MTERPATTSLQGRPAIVDQGTWQTARDALLVREKAHTREGDAIAAARRRLPMVEIDGTVEVTGPDGVVPFIDLFQGRDVLLAHKHMWHDGAPPQGQCEGCSTNTWHIQRAAVYLNARGVSFAVLTEGPWDEVAPFVEFMGYTEPWYSVRGVDGPVGDDMGSITCYLRDGDRVFLTYRTTGRGNEPAAGVFGLLDMTPYGRGEAWEETPDGWPEGQDPCWYIGARTPTGTPRGARPAAPCHSGRARVPARWRPWAGMATTDVVSELERFLVRHVEAGTVPGAVALRGGHDPEVVAAGVASADGRPMRDDAIMRIQSMTKAITSVAALRLVEAGRLGLDQSVEEWLPELAGRRVLSSPTAPLHDTVPANRPITLRHLLTMGSGYGMEFGDTPLQKAMADNGTEAGPDPIALGAGEWLARLAKLPLAFQPGEGWRYHHSFAVLGILIARLTGRPLGVHLAEDLFDPLGMPDSAFWVPEEKLNRLPAAYRRGDGGLEETEPAGGGFYAGPPPFDVSHGELVCTARDYHRFLRALMGCGRVERVDGAPLISDVHLRHMTSDQVPAENKTADSFYPGFWDGMGWGFGVGIETTGPRRGRFGWSGGQGTNFYVDPDGTIGILLTQVEMGEHMSGMIDEFQALPPPS